MKNHILNELFGHQRKLTQDEIYMFMFLTWVFWPQIKKVTAWTWRIFIKLMKIQLFMGPEYKVLGKVK